MANNAPKFTGLSFDASKVAPAVPLEPVPADNYTVTLTDGEVVPTADGSGERLKFELTIMDGPFKGRKVWDGLNIKNQSAKAQEIAHQQLSAICYATGVINLQDVQQFYGRPFTAKIGLDPRRQDANDAEKWYDPRNTFKGAKPLDGGAAAPGAVAMSSGAPVPAWLNKPAPGAAPAAGAAPANAPWLKAPAAAPAQAAAPAAAPVAAPAASAPTKPKGPAAPKAAAPAPKVERKFFVFIGENEMPLKSEAEVAEMLSQGMPAETQVSLADKDGGFDDAAGWHPTTKYAIGNAAPPPASTPAGAAVVPPWMRKP